MFPQSAPDHPCEKSAPQSSPAGLRVADYINPKRYLDVFRGPDFDMRSPDPSPLNSPTKDPRHLADVSLPSRHFPGHFSVSHDNVARPSAPTSNNPRKKYPKVTITDASDDDLPGRRPLRRARFGSKHLSFAKHNGSGIIPHHRRARHMQEKRETVRKRMAEQHEQRAAEVYRSLSQLLEEAETLMTPENMDDQDKVFLEQLEKLGFQQKVHLDKLSSAAVDTGRKRKALRPRNEGAAKKRKERQADEDERMDDELLQANAEETAERFRRMEEAALRADIVRQRAHEILECRIREEQDRLFREERKRVEEERKLKEEEERREEERKRKEEERKRKDEERKRKDEKRKQEERERRQHAAWKQEQEKERQRLLDDTGRRLERLKRIYNADGRLEREAREERERRAQEERERQAREERERLAREERERQAREERERQARLRAEQARLAADRIAQERKHLEIYEGKWNELRTSDTLPPINVWDFPWPVFGVISSAEQITNQDVRKFLFHPQRPGVEGKTPRDKIKMEVLRFHPDKFNTRVLPKIVPSQQAVTRAIAGAVARVLTSIMTEDVEMQN